MEYRYGKNENYEDFSSGRVLYNAKNVTNFPVRLAQESYGRCLEYSDKQDGICLYDCCCGGGYLLTVLGFLNQDTVAEIIGSDIDEKSLEIAQANLSLLTYGGMQKRISGIKEMIEKYNKQSHLDAERSALKLISLLRNSDIKTSVFAVNVLEKIILDKTPDIIITDVPYGNLVSWEGPVNILKKDLGKYMENDIVDAWRETHMQDSWKGAVDLLLDSLYEICGENTIIGICMDKNQKVTNQQFIRLEKQLVGKRKFEILRKKVNK